MKVLISVPSFDHVHADFAFSLAAMLGKLQHDSLRRPLPISLHNPRSTLIFHARNLGAQAALDSGATHLLFLDSDMTFPPDTLTRLASHAVPIVGADYVRRVPPHTLCGTASGEPMKAGLRPMISLPFGCILIKTEVLREMERPWFQYREGITDADTLSEDTGWCNQARRLGHTIHCDPRLEVGHVGSKVFTPKDTVQP